METKRSLRLAAGLIPLALAVVSQAAWADPPRSDSPTVVKGVVVTATVRSKPTDAPPPLEAYARRPVIEQIALSPDGAQVAFVATVGGVRVLIAHRFADKTRRMVRLMGGDVSALAWSDNDHVLVTASKSALRGTCDAGDERAIEVNAMAASMALQNYAASLQSGAAGADPRSAIGSVGSGITGADALALGSGMQGHPCVYYGVREQSAVTSIDMEKKTGRSIGLRLGDFENMPLGTPARVTLKGKAVLAGPFLERRMQAVANEPAERVYLWNVDPKTTGGYPINDGGGDLGRETLYVDDWLTTRDGQLVARSLYNFDKGVYVIQMRIKGAWKPVLTRPISPRDHTFAPYLIGLGAHDGSIVILDAGKPDGAETGGRSFHYYELSPDGTLSGPLEPVDAARDRPILDSRSMRVAGFAERGAAGETYALEDSLVQSLYQRAQDSVPGETVRVASTAEDPRKMVIYSHGREDPGAYYFLDFSEGSSIIVGDDYPQIPTDWVASQSQIAFKASDGLEINAVVTVPPKPKAQNLPLVVLPHDGLQAHDGLDFDWLAQALASRGYLVLQPNVRGSDGADQAYMAAGWGQLGRKMQSDVADSVRVLVSEGLADPKRVCILGVGFGGYAALTAAATDASTFRCAGAINAVSDPQSFAAWQKKNPLAAEQDQITPLVADTEHPRSFEVNPASPQVLASYMGADGQTPSALKLAASVSVPVLLIHETNDASVPASQSRALRDALQASHKDVQLVELKGPTDHALATPENRLATLMAVLDFLAKQNPAN